MNDFTFQSPTRFVFGRGTCDATGAELAALGHRRALLVYGGGSVVRCGTLARVTASLDAAGIERREFGGVRPNPSVELVREGVVAAREQGCDVVLAVGGGSVVDTAKAIALGVSCDADVWDVFEGTARPDASRMPAVACVPPCPARAPRAAPRPC